MNFPKQWHLKTASLHRVVMLFFSTTWLVACHPASIKDTENTLWDVTTDVSKDQITSGDWVDVRIDAYHSPTARVLWPPLDESITVHSEHGKQQLLDEGIVRTTRQWTLTAFRVGEHLIIDEPVRFELPDGTTQEADIPALFIKVQSLLEGGEAPLRPMEESIEELLEWPSRIPRWLIVFLSVALLAALAGFIAKQWLDKDESTSADLPAPSPHQLALERLRALLEKEYIETGKGDPFYTELSLIVRQYLEDRFDLRAPESTTEEFIRDASQADLLSADHQALVNDFLIQSDLVKFARHRPSSDDMMEAHRVAVRLVKETIPEITEQTA